MDDDLQNPDGTEEADALDPGLLCIMHLENLADDFGPAEVAYLLGNSPQLIQDAIDFDREQEQLASAAALEAQTGDEPDWELARVNLGEARSWAQGAQLKSQALQFVLDHRPPEVDFGFVDELAEIQRWELAWLNIHTTCDEHWNATTECPVHGEAIKAGRNRQHDAALNLARQLREAVTPHPAP